MFDYRESQFKEIIERGIYSMANVKLSQEWTDELRSRGHDFYVLHGVGSNGTRDIIFHKNRAREIYATLNNLKERAERELSALSEIMPVVYSLCK